MAQPKQKNSLCRSKAALVRLSLSIFCILPLLYVSACSSIKQVPQNVSSWTEKIARPESQLPSECFGWQKIELKSHSRYLLIQKEPKLLINIDAHNLRGRNLGCWT